MNGAVKTSSAKKYLVGAGVLGSLGALYGMGDSEHNYRNDFIHKSTGSRAAQGSLAGLAGIGGYGLARGLGRGRVISGLAGLLSSAGAAALARPNLPTEDPYKLPF